MSLSLSCRNIPLAVIVSVITVIVGYMLTNISYYTVLGMQDVLASPAVAVVSRPPLPPPPVIFLQCGQLMLKGWSWQMFWRWFSYKCFIALSFLWIIWQQ